MCVLFSTTILQEILFSAGSSDWQYNMQTANRLYSITIYIILIFILV